VSVLAEAIHSGADLIGSSVAFVSVRLSDAPPDEDHAYGHGKFENLSGVLIGLFIIGAGVYAVVQAADRLTAHSGRVLTNFAPGIAVMALSSVMAVIVSRHLLAVGRETDSPALVSDGMHLRTDIVSASSVLVSLIIQRATHWTLIDPLVAFLVAAWIFWIGARTVFDAVLPLVDVKLPPGEEQSLRNALDADPRVLGYHAMRTRKSGSQRHVDVHVQIADTLSFVDAHRLCEDIEEELRHTLPNLLPIVHVEPFEEEIAHQQEAHPDVSANDKLTGG
jgi:cation diffusion facilitator family transporter